MHTSAGGFQKHEDTNDAGVQEAAQFAVSEVRVGQRRKAWSTFLQPSRCGSSHHGSNPGALLFADQQRSEAGEDSVGAQTGAVLPDSLPVLSEIVCPGHCAVTHAGIATSDWET